MQCKQRHFAPLRLSVLALCLFATAANAQLEPMVNPAQIRKMGIESITVTLYNGDQEGNRHGRGEKERYYLYDPAGNILERNFYPEKPAYNRTVIYEYRKGKLWRESLNKGGNLQESTEVTAYAGNLPAVLKRKDPMGKLQATEERTYLADTLLAEVRLYDTDKQLVTQRTITYLPGTALVASETETRAGNKRKVLENTYDAQNRLISQKVYDNTGAHVRNVTYTYDEAGRQTRKLSKHLDGTLAEDLYYTWDDNGQLIEEYVKYADIDLRDSRQHTYDNRGLHIGTLAFEASTRHWRVATFEYTFYKKD
jgi:hypothetical protein